MNFKPQIKVAATYMRGGTSKGVFFRLQDLPAAAQNAGVFRDRLLQRIIGSPDPYAKHTDGMGGATSSTSKVVILSKSARDDHDVDYLFGQVSIDTAFVDWSGNCGNLSAAVGPFAISNGLVKLDKIPQNGCATIKIWQSNIQKTIIAHVPIMDGMVQESGDFELDGVTFPAAEIPLEFIDPADDSGDDAAGLFPSGNVVDTLDVPESLVAGGKLQVTLINAGIPTIFVNAQSLGYSGKELQDDINSDPQALARFEALRAIGAVKMGLIKDVSEAVNRQHTPKIAIVAQPQDYTASSSKAIKA
ncbi:2-methylaconitate cis-trans isomerase PrpF, partial [Paraglaciecola sp.]|uniref:2-methylaconitate cis-trans isomerase PrpF n=1 Tax=Paraglaciecola sp. TaxID=1920173 RepID=UPI0030F4A57A